MIKVNRPFFFKFFQEFSIVSDVVKHVMEKYINSLNLLVFVHMLYLMLKLPIENASQQFRSDQNFPRLLPTMVGNSSENFPEECFPILYKSQNVTLEKKDETSF